MDKVFPIHIYKYTIDDYKDINKDLITEIYDLKNSNLDEGMKKSNHGGWHSNTNPYKFKKLQSKISHIINDNIFDSKLNWLEWNDCWVNINDKGSFNSPHNHPGSYFSGVYYVKTPKDSGNLVFINPFFFTYLKIGNMIEQSAMVELEKHQTRYWTPSRAIQYVPREGDLYIFHGNVPHAVETNLSDEDRISISFNYNLRDIAVQFENERRENG